MKISRVFVSALALVIANHSWAGDLESILDEGEKAPVKSTVAAVVAKTSPMAIAIRKLLKDPNAEQNLLIQYLEEGNWEKVSSEFPKAFEGTEFQKSTNGHALFGLALFHSGLPVSGVQALFVAPNPKEMNSLLREEWQKIAPEDHYVWGLAKVAWRPEWEQVFTSGVELRLKMEAALSTETSLEQLEKLSSESPTNSRIKGDVDWRLVIAYSLKDQSDQAAKLLAQLMKNPKAAVSSDLMQLTAARMLFQNGYFDPSIKYYEKIPKASPYWTEAQEEMGWAYIRKGQPNNALALSQSLVQAGFNYQVSPETYFVRSLSQLKMCDYTGVMGSLNEFPQRFKERTKALEKLSQDSATAEVANGIETLKTRKVGIQDLGKIAKMLPRRFSQDQKLFELAQSQMHLESEVKNAEKLLTAPQPVFENIKTAVLQQMQSVKTASYDRVKELARDEVTETKEILRKLHIVEAEVIQQVSFADKIAKNAVDKGDEKKGVTGYKGVAQTVSFPAEKEVWVDELSNYRLDVKKACTVKR